MNKSNTKKEVLGKERQFLTLLSSRGFLSALAGTTQGRPSSILVVLLDYYGGMLQWRRLLFFRYSASGPAGATTPEDDSILVLRLLPRLSAVPTCSS